MKFKILIIAPIVIGMFLIILGIATQSDVIYAGIGVLFGGSFLVALFTAVITIFSIGKGVKGRSSTASEKEDDDNYYRPKEVDDVFDTDSDVKGDDYDAVEEDADDSDIDEPSDIEKTEAELIVEQISSVKKAVKHSRPLDGVFGCLFVLAFIGCIVGAMALFSTDHTVPGIILFVSAFALVIGALIVVKIKERIAMSQNYDPADFNETTGVVRSCMMSSSVSTGRRTSITYKIFVEADGKKYIAYSHRQYAEGKTIPVLVHRTKNIIKLIEPSTIKRVKIDNAEDYDSYEDEPIEVEEKKTADTGYNYCSVPDLETIRKQQEAAPVATEEKSDERQNTTSSAIPSTPQPQTSIKREVKKAALSTRKRSETARSPLASEPTPTAEAPDKKPDATHRPNVGYKGINRKK